MEDIKKWACANCYKINAGIGILFLFLPLFFDCYSTTVRYFSPFFLVAVLILALINLLNETICKRKIIYLVNVSMYFVQLVMILYPICADIIRYKDEEYKIISMAHIYIPLIVVGLIVSYWQQKQHKNSVEEIEQKEENI